MYMISFPERLHSCMHTVTGGEINHSFLNAIENFIHVLFNQTCLVYSIMLVMVVTRESASLMPFSLIRGAHSKEFHGVTLLSLGLESHYKLFR